MLKLTENAIHRLHWIAERNNSKYCRLSVKGGGCAGYEYEWSTCNEQEEGDRLFNDILCVHKDFEFYLFGTILDWEESKFKSEFTITNPNSKSTCGCGESFSV